MDFSDIEKHFFEVKEMVENRIEEVSTDIKLKKHVFEYVLGGGKRIRPFVCIVISEALGGDIKRALDYAVAVEIFHCSSLIHDDILDADEIRRGKATLWKALDVKRAVWAGDYLFSFVVYMLRKYGLEEMGVIVDTIKCMAEGIYEEVENSDKPPSLEEYLTRAYLKTGTLFGAASRLGAISANSPTTIKDAFWEYGVNLGYVFQMTDDMVDVIKSKNTGMLVGDLANKTISFPLTKMYDEKTLHEYKKNLLSVEEILSSITDDMVDSCFEEIEIFKRKCLEAITPLSLRSPYKEYLLTLPIYAKQSLLS